MKRVMFRRISTCVRAALRVCFLLLLAWGAPLRLTAQSGAAGSIHGTVLDPSGLAVPNAAVQATPPGGGNPLKVTSNTTGTYNLNNVPAGTYTIEVTVAGFAPYSKPNVVVVAGGTLQLDINLAIEQQKEQVTVSGDTLTVDTSPSNNASAVVLSGSELDALPDDPDELQADLNALAGPTPGPNGGQMYIDGFTAGQLPPKSSIREVRINQNPFSAQYDKVGYGRVEIFTKPGTDQWHGQSSVSATDVLFNARNPFVVGAVPPYHSLQANENLGGPLNSKSSIFFNLDYRNIDDQSVVSATTLDPTGTEEVPFSTTVQNLRTRWNVGPRVDYQLTKNNTLSVRYQYFRNHEINDGIGGPALPSQAYNALTTEHTLQITDTQLIGSKMISELQFQYLGDGAAQMPESTAPSVSIPQTVVMGGSSGGNTLDWQNHFEIQDYTSYAFGKHFLKFGVRLREMTENNSNLGGFNGAFTFACVLATSCANALSTVNTPNPNPAQFQLTTGLPGAHLSLFDAGPYIEDEWRVRPNVTLDYGLRFESQNDIHDWADWAPRVGAAWGVGGGAKNQPKVVLRAGFGVFYDRFGSGDILQGERVNGVIETDVTIDNPGFYCTTLPACPSLTQMEANSNAEKQIFQIAPNLHAPYILQSGASAERALTKQITLSIAYLNSQGRDQLITNNVNAPVLPGTEIPTPVIPCNPPMVTTECGGEYPNGAKEIIDQYQTVALYHQSQMIVNTTIRAGTRLVLNGFYSLNYTSGDVSNNPSNPYNLMADYGRSPFDVRHRGFVGGTAVIPWAIRISPFLVVNSGAPYNITLAQDIVGSSFLTQRPGFVSTQTCAVTQIFSGMGKTNNEYCTRFGTFDADPTPGEPVVPINYLTGPGRFSLNLRVARTFSFGEKAGEARAGGPGGKPTSPGGNSGKFNFIVGVSARNIFNNVNFGTPVGVLTSPLFGQSNTLAVGGGPGVGGPGGSAANRAVYLEGTFAF